MASKSDILVIGAGVVGLSTAYYLAKEGYKVTVLEMTDGANSCSHGNAGLISPSHFIPLSSPGIVSKGLRWMMSSESPFYIKPRFSWTLIQWLWQFMKHSTHAHVNESKNLLMDLILMSFDLHKKFAQEHAVPMNSKGVILQCLTQASLEAEIEVAKMANDMGQDTEVYSIDQLNEFDPSLQHRGVGAVHFKNDAFVRPEDYMTKITNALKDAGVEIHYNAKVTDFEVSGSEIKSVLTEINEFEANEVVLTTGSYTPGILKHLGHRMLLEPGKGYSVDWNNPAVTSHYSYILLEARVAVTPFTNILRLAGTMELVGVDLSVNQKRVKGFLKSIQDYLPEIEYDQIKNLPVWSGLRPCSPDGLPYIGRDSKYNNLTIAAGHAMLGFTLGPATGLLVKQILNGEKTIVEIDRLAVGRYS